MKKYIILLLIFSGFSFSAISQNKRATINLLDSKTGKAIESATVYIDYQKQRLSSNYQGFVSFVIPSDNQVKISATHLNYIKLDTIINVSKSSTVTIMLKPIESVDISAVEVFHTGYQSVPKERQTGSFTLVSSDLLEQQTDRSILNRLPAVTSGLMLDNATSTGNSTGLKIRGLSSIRGVKEPLIILDGFPYEGNIENINPDDIKNVTLLKDAAAASIWGAQAGNGVIVITTRKTKADEKIHLRYSSNLSFANKPDIRYANTMNSEEFLSVERFLFDNGFYDRHITSTARRSLSPAVQLMQRHRLQEISSDRLEKELGILANHDGIKDFEKYVYDQSMYHKNHIEAQGGNSNYSWLLSGSYDENKNELSAYNKRFNMRSFQNITLAKDFVIELVMQYSDLKEEPGKLGLRSIRTSYGDIIPYQKLVDLEGNHIPIMHNYNDEYISNIDNGRLLDWKFIPLDDWKNTIWDHDSKAFSFNPSVNYSHKSGLKINGRYNYLIQKEINDDLYNEKSYFARDIVNSYTQFDYNGDPIYIVPKGGVKDIQRANVISHNARLQFGYDKSWRNSSINLLLGGERLSTEINGSAQRIFGFDEENFTSGPVDLTKTYPNLLTGISSWIPGRNSVYSQSKRFLSFYFNGSFDLKHKYIFSASLRRDASNFFGMSINDSWNPLGSVGIAWNVSNESFFKSNLISNLKLRATYGKSGNINNNMVARTTIQYRGNSPLTARPMAQISNFPNPSLRWEKVSMTNLAIDLNFKGDRVALTLEAYKKRAKDLFGESPVDYTTGLGYYVIKNVATMEGLGADLILNTKNIKGDFLWDSQLNLSFNTDKVKDYYLSNSYGRDFVGRSSNVSANPGYPVYGVYSYQSAGLNSETGMPRGYLNNEISENYASIVGTGTDFTDLIFHGSSLPKFFGSIGNRFSYGKFSIDTRIVFKLRYFLRRSTVQYYSLFNSHLTHGDFINRWQSTGDELITDIPSLTYPFSASAQNFYTNTAPFVFNASHIRLQYIRLNYNFTVGTKQQTFKVNTYIHLDNLGLLWRKNSQKIDPDVEPLLGNFPNPIKSNVGMVINF